MTHRPFAIALAALSIAAARASAVITLDASYDNASLKSYTVSAGPFTPPAINLVGRDNYFGSGEWRWMNFTATGLSGQLPKFNISDNFAGGAAELNTHPMVYSVDNGATWKFFDDNSRANGVYSFSNNTSFTTNSVQVAYAIPYSYAKSVADAQAVINSPWGAPTLSGGTTGVIGQSPGGTDDLGRAVAPRDIYAYRITNTAFDNLAKKKVVISTGLHAGETLGTYTYQGLINFLTSDDPHAAVLRDVAEFYSYPMLNPDGRFAGNNRATIANPNVEPNGQWNPSLWTGTAKKDIRVNGTAMIADKAQTASPVEAYIDFHSTVPSDPGEDFGFLEYEQGDNLAPWWTTFKAKVGTVVDTDSTGSSWTTANFAEAFLGAKVDVTFETQFGRRRNVDYYDNLGKQLGLSFFETYKPTDGDSNFDGKVNFDDLAALAQHYNATDTLWEHGDFDFSGKIDFGDLVLLAQHYSATGLTGEIAGLPGDSTFAADWALAQSLVPEPMISALALGMVLMAGNRRR